uniref:V-type proton ATPase subunit a n=1 Tax=Ditylenchus dipsaci TaxID=166011 RepID=A0A915D6M0_9BILA
MGSLYRSEEMSLCQLFLQTDSAFASVAELGELGLCQFRDLNPEVSSYMRKYVLEVKRCDEMERKIRFVEKELEIYEIDMNDLEAKFDKLEDELRIINNSTESLRKNYMHLLDMKHVLLKIRVLFDEGQKTQALQQIAEVQHGHAGPLVPTTNGFNHLNQSINSDLDKGVVEKGSTPLNFSS